MPELEKAIARIFNSDKVSIVGVAFLVGRRQLLTCAHVVYSALDAFPTVVANSGELPEIYLDFPLIAPNKKYSAKVSLWMEIDQNDIVGLDLNADPPKNAKPVKLGIFSKIWGHTFRVFGFPIGYMNGVWTSGKILSRDGTGMLQIQGDQLTGYTIAPGFSGSPIWDNDLNCVVGMIAAVDSQENRKVAFGIPSATLIEAWPKLTVEQGMISQLITKPQIYISSTLKSKDIALEIENELSLNGFGISLSADSQQQPTKDVVQMYDLLENSDQLILLLTPDSVEDKNVFQEWFYFYSQKKAIHCLMVEKCEPPYQLRPFQFLPWDNERNRDWAKLKNNLMLPFRWPNPSLKENVVQSVFAPPRSLPESLTALNNALLNNQIIALSPDQLKEIKVYQPSDDLSYKLARYSEWCSPKYRLDERFVRLTMIVDKGEESENRWEYQEGQKMFDDLRQVINDEDSVALVLLGAPGAGKSTLLRRLEMDISLDGIRGLSDKITFFVSLAEYGVGLSLRETPSPLEWLSNKWKSAYPLLPSFREILLWGKILLLLDSLNEISHSNMEEYRQRIEAWRAFVHTYIRDIPGNRAVFACRSLDYGGLLSSKEFTVQQIRVEPMTYNQVNEYLTYYALEAYSLIWDEISGDNRLFELFRVPFLLQLLIDRVRSDGIIPKSKAELFTSFVRSLLRREVLSEHPSLKNGVFLTDREWKHVREGEKHRDLFYLPDRGLIIPSLTQLAYSMQERKPGEDKGQVVIDYYDALSCLEIETKYKDDVIKTGCDLSILDEENSYIKYYHQLLQEFFAARQLAIHPNLDLVRAEWRANSIQPHLHQVMENLAYGDPLPLLTTTGWEETTVMATEMASNPADYIWMLTDVNLPLAGRCAANLGTKLNEKIKKQLSLLLLQRMEDPKADLRARISAGLTIGYLNDPRYISIQGHFGEFMLPPLIDISGGEYWIGSNDKMFSSENPRHQITVTSFQIGKYPVTNGEFALFVKSGGYENDTWWETDSAKTWRSGQDAADGPKQDWRERRRILQAESRNNLIHAMAEEGKITAQQAEYREKMARMSDEEFETLMSQWYPLGKKNEPAYWNDEVFNNPSQPVVGVNWYEARAYCSWLTAQVESSGIGDIKFDLPTEIEWEVSAKSFEEHIFAFGNEYNRDLCNTFETHIRRTTPVGIFLGGNTINGCVDMTGNVYEWMRNEIRPYPYDQHDGRENLQLNNRKVLRGGSWRSVTLTARNTYRGTNFPISRNFDYGFRLFTANMIKY